MAKRVERPIPLSTEAQRGHPRLTTARGRLVIYVVCHAGSGKRSRGISGYFSIPPGTSFGKFRQFWREWLRQKLEVDYKGIKGYQDMARWNCVIDVSAGDLPPGSSAVDVD